LHYQILPLHQIFHNATVIINVGPPIADLNVTKQVNNATVPGGIILEGSTFNYTVIVTNNGPDTAQNVTLFDIIPANVTFVGTNSTCSFSFDEVDCDLGDIPNGNTTAIEIQVTVDSGFTGFLKNTVEVFSDTVDPHALVLMWGKGVDDGTPVSQICTSNCQAGTFGSGDGQFGNPFGITADSADNVYVVDNTAVRVQKFDDTGTFVLKWGSFCRFVPLSGCVDPDGAGPLELGDGQFDTPFDVTADSAGNVYVADSLNDRIQKFDSSGNFLLKFGAFGGNGSSGSGDGQFNDPRGVAVDSAGNVYVVEFMGQRVQKFDSNGTFITKWGSSGSGDGQFNTPRGVAVDSSGNVYVADHNNHRVQKFDSNGTFITKWGSSGSGDGQFSFPKGIAVDSADNVYVVDQLNDRIQKFDSDGTFITKWGSSGSGDGQFNSPQYVAVDSDGNVYVSEQNNRRIQKFEQLSLFSLSSTVQVSNTPPVANDDFVTTPEDTPLLDIAVLVNDTDVESDPLIITNVTIPQNGTATINGTQTGISYTPIGDFNGIDSFNYTISDGIANSTATVFVDITPVNDPPVATNDDTTTVSAPSVLTTAEDTALDIATSELLSNDSDVDADTLSITAVSAGTAGTPSLDPSDIV